MLLESIELRLKNCSYIINAKAADHKYLYDYFWAGDGEDIGAFESDIRNKYGIVVKHQKYRFMNDVPLNDSNYDLKVNVLYFEEHDTKTKKLTKWLWVTDININTENAKFIMKGGRARWRIENETFNTLKNQGYNFGHNFGHGYKGLCNVFAVLMLISFFIDQVLEAYNLEVQALRAKGSRSSFYEKVRSFFHTADISNFENLYDYMLHPPPKGRVAI